MKSIKKVLVADWLDAYGGAERVIKSIEEVCRFDITYTLICLMHRDHLFKIYQTKTPRIVQTFVRHFGKPFRYFFFTFHFFVDRIKVPKDVKLIVSSSHSVAKGVRKSSPDQLHISYFQARNFNYIWEDAPLFFGKFQSLFSPLILFLRKIDVAQAQRPDYIVANSNFVRDWVKFRYNRDADVIYPPVDLSQFDLQEQKEEFYVTVGRIVTVKKFDIVVEAFNQNKKKLVVIGDGLHRKELEQMASPNIHFTGFLDTKELRQYISKAKGFIQSGVEGFGIATLEAQACGTPVIAFGQGGVLETVVEGKTGVFFEEQTTSSLLKAIEVFEQTTFDAAAVRIEALRFSEERFKKELGEFIEQKLQEHNV
ncbi:glycosyltransferase [Flavobacterium caeni]|uniref:Glycosyltransferase involved in cell wall bisynthesis n=1 Tax=Flavobacterium caeni TaxID=490189 RepID=A0A1G5JB34_9FLAO|nr:glycosyltransferase [Flavobacterium caeni]SCY85457.1 Glycosyltransferase involved in cell wall bisynthesis [Flavobacterium caeni]